MKMEVRKRTKNRKNTARRHRGNGSRRRLEQGERSGRKPETGFTLELQRLTRAEEELLAIYENAPISMVLVDSACRIRRTNKMADMAIGMRLGQNLELGAAFRCVEALRKDQGCGFGPGCSGCVIRNNLLDTLRTGRKHTEVEITLPIQGGGHQRTLNLLVSTSRIRVRRQPHVLLTFQNLAPLRKAEAALKASESALRKTESLAAVGSWEWDIQTGRHVWSEEVYRIYGQDPALQPLTYPEVKSCFTPESWESLAAAVEQALAEGVPYEREAEVIRPDGSHRWITARGEALRGFDGRVARLYGTVQDITDRKSSEQRIARLNRAQAILAAVDHAIVHIQDQQKLLDEICRVAADKGGFRLVWIGLVMPGGSINPVSQAGQTAYLEDIRVVVHDEPEGRGPVGTAIREQRPVVIQDVDRDPRMAPWRERAQQFGLHYVAAFPIRVGNKVAGSFQLYAANAAVFDEEEVNLLTQVSDDISFALTAIDARAERLRVQRELGRSEQELADFFAAAPLGLLWVADDGRILRVNEAELELLGRDEKEVLGHCITEFGLEPEMVTDVLARILRKETVLNYRARIRRRNGSVKHILVDANGLWEREHLVHSRWFVRDITDRVDLEREILAISEREQRRLGHDLHDDLCQQLAGIEFLSQSLARDLARQTVSQAPQAKEISQLVQHAMNQTRELAHGLSPVGMEAEGLMEGLGELASRTRRVFRLECQFRCPALVLVPDDVVAIHLYRIAQEAVGNAVKHGKAKRIEIALTSAGSDLQLRVHDNGTGLPRTVAKPKGMGLRIMRYRAGVIGGSLVVQSNPDGGTTVTCTIPDGVLPPHSRNNR